MSGVPLRWERREPPLEPVAVLALDAAVPALAAATRSRLRAGARLAVAADGSALLVLGDAGDLPWADGARYLGSDGGVLVPTTARPWPAAPLWRAALGATTAQLCALVPGHALVTDPPAPGCDPAALDRFLTADGAAASKATAAATEAVATAETGETAGGRPGSGRNAT